MEKTYYVIDRFMKTVGEVVASSEYEACLKATNKFGKHGWMKIVEKK